LFPSHDRWGSGGVNAGIITATAATDSTITAVVSAGINQTQMAIYAISSNYSIAATRIFSNVIGGTGSGVRLQGQILLMEDPVTYAPDNAAWTEKEGFTVVEDSQPWEAFYDPPKCFTGPCIVKLQLTSDTNNAKALGGIDGFILKN